MKKRISIVLLACILLLFSGCHRSGDTAPTGHRVVTEVSVTCQDGTTHFQRRYSRDESMHGILEYLRRLEPQGASEVQFSELTRSHFEITVTCSDGYTQTYEQCADRYFLEPNGVWQSIDPEQAAMLSQLIRDTPGDV